ncbi:MAG TPA: TraR/DksA C4-type zinc finger protein [Thermoanaerobaculia bacterium]|nr:TraR/DksA C4-type zinc finger protein [Thermoanaerobaculia bacterium]
MSELTQEQLEQFRERLLTAKDSIEETLRQSAGERPVERSGSTIGRLSRMDAMQVQAMAQMGRRQLETRLNRIEAALATMDAGTYGMCRECKEPISLNRLEALPEAPFCVPCQESFEQ